MQTEIIQPKPIGTRKWSDKSSLTSRPSAASAKLGLGPRQSEVEVRREAPSASGLHGSAGLLLIFCPKARFTRHIMRFLGLTCFRAALAACAIATATLESLCRKPAHAGPCAASIGQAARHSWTKAVENAIATEPRTTAPGVLCSEEKRDAITGSTNKWAKF